MDVSDCHAGDICERSKKWWVQVSEEDGNTNYNDNSYYHFVSFALEILPSKRLNI